MGINKLALYNKNKTSSASKYGPTTQTIVEFYAVPNQSGIKNEQYFTIPDGVKEITVIAWGAAGGSYYDGTQSGFGGSGGFVSTKINVIEKELTIVVGSTTASGSYSVGGYGGGGNGTNGGSAGGGASMIISGRRSNLFGPYSYSTNNGTQTQPYYPTSTLTSLIKAEELIAVAGGGGGAGWYGSNTGNLHGGCGGGVFGAPGVGNGTPGTGGTQSTGGSAPSANGLAGVYLGGGSCTNNYSSGGSGGGGGGYYGGGAGYHTAGVNSGGGGGSSFAGFADGSMSTVLIANQPDGFNYLDSTTRKNGMRTYTNTYLWRSGNTGATPPWTLSQPNSNTNVYTSPVGTGGSPSYYSTYGDGKVVLIY